MNTSHQAGGTREKTGTERGTGVEAQTYIPDGMTGTLRGVLTGVEVGVEINPTGTKGPGTPGTGSPLIPGSTGITDATACSAIQHVELKMSCIFQIQ